MQEEQTDPTSCEMKWIVQLRRIQAETTRFKRWSTRRLVVVALAAIPLAFLFALGFFDLMLVLVFPGRSATH